jgi:hypothetical protein
MIILNVQKSFEKIVDSPYGVEILKKAWEMYNNGETIDDPPPDGFPRLFWQLEAQQEWDLFINMPTYQFNPEEILPFARMKKEDQAEILRIGSKLKLKYFGLKSFAKYELVYDDLPTMRDVI